MDRYFYFQCIRRTYLGFLNIFDNIKVHRYDESSPKDIKVPLKIAPKRKFYLWLNDRKFEKHYPIMAGSLNSISLDTQRQTNANHEFKIGKRDLEDPSEIFKILNPIPYNFSFSLTIATKYLTDMDQIVEQIIPFFSPFVIFRLSFPEIDMNVNVRLKLDSINLDTSEELGMEQIKTYASSLDFTCESFVFVPVTDEKLIKKIIIPYYEKFELPKGWDSLTVDLPNRKLTGEYDKNKEVQYFEGAIQDGQKVIKYELFDGNRDV